MSPTQHICFDAKVDPSQPLVELREATPPSLHGSLSRLNEFVALHGDHDETHGLAHVSWVSFNAMTIAKVLSGLPH